MKYTFWWYDDSSCIKKPEDLYLARMEVQANGTTIVVLESGERHEFSSADEADCWLTDEEFHKLGTMPEEIKHQFAYRNMLKSKVFALVKVAGG